MASDCHGVVYVPLTANGDVMTNEEMADRLVVGSARMFHVLPLHP